MADRQGIDVSRWQGNIDWSEVADAKDFAIIRCTSGRSNALDSKYPANLRGALGQGLPIGVYRYGYATTVAAARAEAAAVLDAIDGYDMPCGVWYDVEWSGQRSLPRATLTAIIRAFCEAVTAGGYQAGIYCNQDWYDNVLDTDALAEYPFWIARYGTNNGQMQTRPDIDGALWGWQYTSVGRVPGISGNVDLDVMYAGFANGAETGGGSSSTTTSKPSNGSGVQVDDSKTDYAQSFVKSYAGQYTTTADLHLRAGAGTSKRSITVLPEGTAVRCYGYYTKQADGTVWLYVVATVGGVKYTGFCSRRYLKKA